MRTRVGRLDWDPFVKARDEGLSYAYVKTGTNYLDFLAPVVYRFLDRNPGVKPDKNIFCQIMDCAKHTYREQ
jgi:hypothetical protein